MDNDRIVDREAIETERGFEQTLRPQLLADFVGQRRIKENFRIATWYNVIAVPVAVIGLATPLVAALAMSLSSITVSLNALRLK